MIAMRWRMKTYAELVDDFSVGANVHQAALDAARRSRRHDVLADGIEWWGKRISVCAKFDNQDARRAFTEEATKWRDEYTEALREVALDARHA